MTAAKLTSVRHMRMTPEMEEAVRILADLEDRPFPAEIRHLTALGLEQECKRLRKRKWRPRQVAFVTRFFQLLGEE